MAWSSKYSAFGTEPLIRQMMAIITRDIQAALDFVSGAPGSLTPFQNYQLAEAPVKNFPALLLVAVSAERNQETVGALEQKIPIVAVIAVAHQDPNRVAIMTQQYAYAVMLILLTAFEATVNDFYAAGLALPSSAYGPGQTTAGLAAGTLLAVLVDAPEFGELRGRSGSMFAKTASIAMEATLAEKAAY